MICWGSRRRVTENERVCLLEHHLVTPSYRQLSWAILCRRRFARAWRLWLSSVNLPWYGGYSKKSVLRCSLPGLLICGLWEWNIVSYTWIWLLERELSERQPCVSGTPASDVIFCMSVTFWSPGPDWACVCFLMPTFPYENVSPPLRSAIPRTPVLWLFLDVMFSSIFCLLWIRYNFCTFFPRKLLPRNDMCVLDVVMKRHDGDRSQEWWPEMYRECFWRMTALRGFLLIHSFPNSLSLQSKNI